MKKLWLWIFLALFFTQAHSQLSRYIVKFTDKGGNTFQLSNPAAFLSTKAIERRTRYGISLDSTDLPVSQKYIDSLKNVPNVTVMNISKWMNQVSIQTNDPTAIEKINSFPFVQVTSPIASITAPGNTDQFSKKMEHVVTPVPDQTLLRTTNITENFYDYGERSLNEMKMHNGEFLHNIGLRGQGMTISMLDAGFFNYNTLDAMDSIVANGQVLSTWDFVNSEMNVANDNAHGMQCLSIISANLPGRFIGKAPKADFHLFVTEDVRSEYPIEEHNWVCGAERSDSAGADIISSSLGYYEFDDPSLNYTYQDMDGNTTIAARGADLAAKKGILVFNAAGNEGNGAWKYIITPADGDSVVAVGAVNTSRVSAGFSSYGPSADGRIKPDVASVGVSAVIQATNNTVATSNGTSFACPNMAGLTACLWQAFPEFNNMKIIETLRKAGDKYTSPDDRTGYGIPDMKKAFSNLLIEYAIATGTMEDCRAKLDWRSKDMKAMKYEIERKVPGNSSYQKIAEIKGQGDLLQAYSYQFMDSLSDIPAGTITYRIKQVIDTVSLTGVYLDSFTLTKSNSCTAIMPNELKTVHIFPNPVRTEMLTIAVNTPTEITALKMQVVNMQGSTILQQNNYKPAGRSLFTIPVSTLPAGKYQLVIWDGNTKLETAGFVKMH
ncbi:MAG: S8 family serine peptidase [Chitinophagaceae bacterium]|jgi:subtilisin family serine protease|nr:S8 family serine peptidase [Chitinophagaceae bacterium]